MIIFVIFIFAGIRLFSGIRLLAGGIGIHNWCIFGIGIYIMCFTPSLEIILDLHKLVVATLSSIKVEGLINIFNETLTLLCFVILMMNMA